MEQSLTKNFIIIGPSGSGKGTQAEIIAKKYHLVHFIMGEALNKIIKENNEIGKKIDNDIKAGKWVPDNIINNIVKDHIEKIDHNQGIIFDGYPRTIEQAEYLDNILTQKGRSKALVINLNVSPKTVTYRLLNRKVCSNCKTLYHPPESLKETECIKCGGKLVKRQDDNEEAIQKRLSEYKEKTQKVINYYQKNNQVINIDGEPEIEKVANEIENNLKEIK